MDTRTTTSPAAYSARLAGNSPRSRRLRNALLAVVATLTMMATPDRAMAAPGDELLTAQAECHPPSGGTGQIVVHPPGPRPTPAVFPPDYVGGNTQRIRYQATLYGWVNGAWKTIATSPLYAGVAKDGWPVDDWVNAYTGQRTNGTWYPPRVNAQRATTLYYKVTGQIWWLSDAYHNGDYAYGTVEHVQWFAGGLSYLLYRMPGYCQY